MRFQEELKCKSREQIWNEYCGYLDLSLSEYMYVQHHLLAEQLRLWNESSLGQALLHGQRPKNADELRRMLPLTRYHDYAPYLLPKPKDGLPGEPIIWIQTTWEGGLRPIKVAPYTRSMLDTYRHHLVTLSILGCSRKKGDVRVKKGDRILYGGAPLPYATGLIPSLLSETIAYEWLPDPNETKEESFSRRIQEGFSKGMQGGIDYFFGVGSVAHFITENFTRTLSGGHSHGGGKTKVSPRIALRYLRAKSISKRDKRPILPKDLFHLKAFFYTGPDSRCYTRDLAEAWGTVPLEIAAGTESTCIACETWEHNGMVFFPDACFYEFIPESELERCQFDPTYTPRTCLMDGVETGRNYELVISVLHGGAFMRYRIGDVYRCVSAGGNSLPRFIFNDRVSSVIDIASFTRITEAGVKEVIELSGADISNWLMKKEYNSHNRPFLHMYVEVSPRALRKSAVQAEILADHLAAYFRYFDSDYSDLKKMLGMEPLQITLLKPGLIAAYEAKTGIPLPKINPGVLDLKEMLQFEQTYTFRDEEVMAP